MPFNDLLQRAPIIWVHVMAAFGALTLGLWLLARRKGDRQHRVLGWAWVALMGTVAFSSLFVHATNLPNIAGYTPIHLLTLWVLLQLPRAVLAARRHAIALHRRIMRGMYVGGCIVAGAFTLMPGRYLGNQLMHLVQAVVG